MLTIPTLIERDLATERVAPKRGILRVTVHHVGTRFAERTGRYGVLMAAATLARRIGLAAAATEWQSFGGVPTLIVERYDRISEGGERRWYRGGARILSCSQFHPEIRRYPAL